MLIAYGVHELSQKSGKGNIYSSTQRRAGLLPPPPNAARIKLAMAHRPVTEEADTLLHRECPVGHVGKLLQTADWSLRSADGQVRDQVGRVGYTY